MPSHQLQGHLSNAEDCREHRWSCLLHAVIRPPAVMADYSGITWADAPDSERSSRDG